MSGTEKIGPGPIHPNELAIGNLLSEADPISKKIISEYKHTAKHSSNVSVLSSSKFTAENLESCAQFLGLKTRHGENDKIYSNKQSMADRITLMIESYFETECSSCNGRYSNSRATPPLLRCFLCFQGSHHCEAFTKSVVDLTGMSGAVWLCKGCTDRNDLCSPTKVKKKKDPNNELEQKSPPDDNEVKKSDDDEATKKEGEIVVPSGNVTESPHSKDTPDPVCPLYIKNAYPHGSTGKKEVNGKRKCELHHPPRCYKFVKNGPTGKYGCNKGKECKYFHPTLCRFSVKSRRCTNKECTYVHLTQTKRWPESEDIIKTNPGNSSSTSTQVKQTPAKPAPRERRDSARSRRDSIRSSRERPKVTIATSDNSKSETGLVQMIKDIRKDFQKEMDQMRKQFKEMLGQQQNMQPTQWLNPSQPQQEQNHQTPVSQLFQIPRIFQNSQVSKYLSDMPIKLSRHFPTSY